LLNIFGEIGIGVSYTFMRKVKWHVRGNTPLLKYIRIAHFF